MGNVSPFLGLSGATAPQPMSYAGTPGPGAQPSPWKQAGSTVFYDDGGVIAPSSVPGGDKGKGSFNAEALFVNGVPVALAGGEVVQLNPGVGIVVTPNPILTVGTIALANTPVTPGGYGDSTHVPTFAVDQQGRLTSAGNTLITYPASLPPSGPAGGALSGTYPNPTLVGGPLSNYLMLSGGTLTGTLNGTLGNFSGPLTAMAATAVPAGGTQDAGLLWSNTPHLGIVFGTGLPNKVQARGTWYQRVDADNVTNPPLYYNIDGTATGWVPFTSGGTVAVGVTPPVAPVDSSLWFYTDAVNGGGTLYIRYNDGNSVQWVPASPAPASSPIPPGSMMDFAGATLPTGWLFANGQLVSRTLYAALFAAIGTAYGAGDGSTTFAVPDLCGRTVAGLDNMGNITAKGRLSITTMTPNATTLGATGGVQTNTAATSIASSGTNNLNFGTQVGSIQTNTWVGPNSGGAPSSSIGDQVYTNINGNFGINVSGAGTSGAFGVVQPTLLMNKIIKT